MTLSNRFVVAGGKAYADIDVLACVSAYNQLLLLQQYEAIGVITAPWNQTIPHSVKKWPLKIEKTYSYSNRDVFILVDISDPSFMEDFISIEKVVEVYDHHDGYETFWKEKLQEKTYIERVGACATLIWEKFNELHLHDSISTLNANLLYTAIFANTLNFRSHVTSNRDIKASEELLAYTQLPKEWKSIYYQEITDGFKENLSLQIQKDTKTIQLQDNPFYFGQVEIWNAAPIIESFEDQFRPSNHEEWLVNIASIEEGYSYFYTNSQRLQEILSKKIETKTMNQRLQVAPRLWLRKELLREILRPS